MNYKELIERLASQTGHSQKKTRQLLGEITSVLSDQLSEGKSVSIPDLGTYDTKINDEKKVYLTLNDKSAQTMEFSLDGNYHNNIFENKWFESLKEYTVSIKGEWVSDDSLNIEVIYKDYHELYDVDITVSGDSLTADITAMPSGYYDVLTAELEND